MDTGPMKDNIFGSEAFILLTEMEMHYRRNKFQNFLQNLALDAHDGLHRKSTLAFIRVATLQLGFTAKLKSNYGQIRPNHFPTGPNFTIFSGQISWLYRMRKYNKIVVCLLNRCDVLLWIDCSFIISHKIGGKNTKYFAEPNVTSCIHRLHYTNAAH